MAAIGGDLVLSQRYRDCATDYRGCCDVQGEAAAPAAGSVSRGDVAEVVVQSLLDPRACNVACTVTESDLLAPTPYEQDISKALEVLQPNQP